MALRTSEASSRISILPDDLWFQTKETDWDEFRVGSTAFIMRSTQPATTTVATPPTPVPATPYNLHEALAKSIKKDPEAYPVFKEARLWDSWNRKLKSMAHLHDLANVLDGNYRTTTKAEAELFELQKHFIYAVFLCKVTAAEAVNIIKRRDGCAALIASACTPL